jgi:hypothetical protein
MICKECGAQPVPERGRAEGPAIRDLVGELDAEHYHYLKDVSLTAKILDVIHPRNPVTSSGVWWWRVELVIGDETRKIRCNIWRPKASEIMEYARPSNKLASTLVGKLVSIRHGWTSSLNEQGRVELNEGAGGEITIRCPECGSKMGSDDLRLGRR